MRSITPIIVMLLMLVACGPDLEDCNSKGDVLAGAWIIKEVFIDDERQEPSSYKGYRLSLETSGDFQRNQPAAFSPDAGKWSLTGGETVLVLEPNVSPAEDYVIESFDLRELVLVLNRNSSKSGPSKIRYILIPE